VHVQVAISAKTRIAGLQAQLESQLWSELESLDCRVLAALRDQPQGKAPLARILGQKQASGPLHEAIRTLLTEGLIKRTIPDKPTSRLQKYRITAAGEKKLADCGKASSDEPVR
jgi:hypothetical protein